MQNDEMYDFQQPDDGGPPHLTISEPEQAEWSKDNSLEHAQDDIQNNLRGRTLQLYFLRMSSKRKIDLITKMFSRVQSLHSLAVILNIFGTVNTKLTSYSKIAIDSNSLYDQYISDHDRVLDAEVLNQSIFDDVEWFETLDSLKQIQLMTNLMRLAGGNIVKKMFWRLRKIFNGRIKKSELDFGKYTSCNSLNFIEEDECRLVHLKEYVPQYSDRDETDYNPHCPIHKKILEGRRQWQTIMEKIKKENDIEVQKLNEPLLQRIQAKAKKLSGEKIHGKKVKKKKLTPRNFSAPKPHNDDIDWVQLLPVWTVKKIFLYLDDKNLNGLRNVNNYWAAISKEVIAEKKMRQQLNATIKKTEKFLDLLFDIPVLKTDLPVEEVMPTETTGSIRRMERQRKTGASLKRMQEPETLHGKSVLNECFSLLDNAQYLTQFKPFPTGIPIGSEVAMDKSLSVPESEWTDMVEIKGDDFGDTSKDNESSKSLLSLVPSIIASQESMLTW